MAREHIPKSSITLREALKNYMERTGKTIDDIDDAIFKSKGLFGGTGLLEDIQKFAFVGRENLHEIEKSARPEDSGVKILARFLIKELEEPSPLPSGQIKRKGPSDEPSGR